jgi:glycosyltransferase involved in cell wall biosynthesis
MACGQNHRQSHCRVGLNAHLLSLAQTYRGAGINGYIYQLLQHLPALDKGVSAFDYVAFLHDTEFMPPPALALARSHVDTKRPWRRILWEQTGLAVLSRKLDLLHGLAFAAPLAAGCPTVITIHDLSFLRFPRAFRWFNRIYLSFITRASARRAARVIAVSESTRQDVIRLCGVPGERVVTVPNGVSATFSPASNAEVGAFRQRKGLPDRFILFVGTLEPRKNLDRLVDAYAFLRQAGERIPPLIIAGGKGWFYQSIFRRVQELGLTDVVLFPGFIPPGELAWWYRAADVFVYPSYFEGFGLPVLEAMACGTPVVTSTASSLPEVAGDAALLVAPEDAVALATALGQVLHDLALCEDLRSRGLARAAQFSWVRTARETEQVYRDALGQHRQEEAR